MATEKKNSHNRIFSQLGLILLKQVNSITKRLYYVYPDESSIVRGHVVVEMLTYCIEIQNLLRAS